MDTHTLTITFSGICTHFKDTVPGVPHRVVLPNASSIQFGLILQAPEHLTTPLAYYLLPHFAILSSGTDPSLLTVASIMTNGHIYSGARLQVSNAIDNGGVEYDNSASSAYDLVPRITDYVPEFIPSKEVVFDERAACYFDIFQGTVSSSQTAGGPINVVVKMTTIGLPILLVTPFGGGLSTEPVELTLHSEQRDVDLSVANTDFDVSDEDKPFDFLLHYLAAQRGLPQILSKATPGLNLPLPLDGEGIQKALEGLGCMIAAGGPTPDQIARFPLVLNESCSDSRYP